MTMGVFAPNFQNLSALYIDNAANSHQPVNITTVLQPSALLAAGGYTAQSIFASMQLNGSSALYNSDAISVAQFWVYPSWASGGTYTGQSVYSMEATMSYLAAVDTSVNTKMECIQQNMRNDSPTHNTIGQAVVNRAVAQPTNGDITDLFLYQAVTATNNTYGSNLVAGFQSTVLYARGSAGVSATGGLVIAGANLAIPSQGGNTAGTDENYGLLISGTHGNLAFAGAGIGGDNGGTVLNHGASIWVPEGVHGGGGTNNYGVRIRGNGASGASNNYALYSESTADAFFTGRVNVVGPGSATAAVPALQPAVTDVITGAVTDGYTGSLRIQPTINAATAQTMTRYNYLDLQNPSVGGAGPATLTDGIVMRFNAAAGTHAAIDGSSVKGTPGGVDAWLKMNINGTKYFVPAYVSKTA